MLDPLNGDQVAAFARDGFVNGGVILSGPELAELSDACDCVIARGADSYSDEPEFQRPVLFSGFTEDGTQIVNMWECSEPFRRLMYHPIIVSALRQLMGCNSLSVWHDQLLTKPPRTGGTLRWHQDAPLWPILSPNTQVSAWVALDDTDAENGCLQVIFTPAPPPPPFLGRKCQY